MTVNDFITISDAKMVTEKKVKQKPSLAELTKVESPGKPTPALQLEKKTKRIEQ